MPSSLIKNGGVVCFRSTLLPLVLSLLVYANSLKGEFVFDDIFAVVENRDVQRNSGVREIFAHDFWGNGINLPSSHGSYRPISVLSLKLDRLVAGGSGFASPTLPFHVTNVVLHTVVVALLEQLLARVNYSTTTTTGPDGDEGSGATKRRIISCQSRAADVALLFAVHPVHTEAVASIVGRAELLSALFFVLGGLCFSRTLPGCQQQGGDKKSSATTVTPWDVLNLGATVLFAGLSMLSKEAGITLIGVCVAWDAIAVAVLPARGASAGRPARLSAFAVRTAFLVAGAAALLFVRMHVAGFQTPNFPPERNPAAAAETPLVRASTFALYAALHLKALAVPVSLCCDWGGKSIPLIEELWDPRLLATLCVFAALGLAGIGCLRCIWSTLTAADARKPGVRHEVSVRVAMGLAFLIIPFVPASNLFFPVGFTVAERVLYLPSIGFCMLLAEVLNIPHSEKRGARKGVGGSSKSKAAALGLIVLLYASKTVDRNSDWSNAESLFRSGIDVNPRHALLSANLGGYLWRDAGAGGKGSADFEQAEFYFKRALDIDPRRTMTLAMQGEMLMVLGPSRAQDAEDALRLAVASGGSNSEARYHLALIRERRHGDLAGAERLLDQCEAEAPGWAKPSAARALMLARQAGRLEEAEASARLAIAADDFDPLSHYALAKTLTALGRAEEAEAQLEASLYLDPHHTASLLDLGDMHMSAVLYESATALFRRALDPAALQNEYAAPKNIAAMEDKLAISLLRTAQSRSGDNSRSHAELVALVEEAVAILEHAIAIDPLQRPELHQHRRIALEAAAAL